MSIVDDATLIQLRREVRAFLAEKRRSGELHAMCDSWVGGFSPEFSRKLGQRGWLGMTWPTTYGGHERSSLERFVVTEELLAAGAPVAAHWVADRQTGPLLLRYGTEEQRQRYLPGIAAGELYVAIGMSEPDSGSDLASIKTRARKVDGGWVVNGTKVWTSLAHHASVLVALVRTADSDDRHDGLSQMLIPLPSEGIDIRPIKVMTGDAHFTEVSLQDVWVPDGCIVGEPGEGWRQVTSELAYERSGPERFLSTYPLFAALLDEADDDVAADLGAPASRLWALHLQSEDVNRSIEAGTADPARPALVKEAGTRLENDIIDVSRDALSMMEDPSPALNRLFREAVLASPAFTLRGGTNEILRGIIAKSWVARGD